MSCFDFAHKEDSPGFALVVGAKRYDKTLSLEVVERARKRRKRADTDAEVALPFGLVLQEQAACVPKAGGVLESESDDVEEDKKTGLKCDEDEFSSESEPSQASKGASKAAAPLSPPPMPAPGTLPPDVETEPEWRPWEHARIVGLKSMDQAPTTRAMCFLCGEKIAQHAWRLDYRIRESSKLADQRRLHMECSRMLPKGVAARRRCIH